VAFVCAAVSVVSAGVAIPAIIRNINENDRLREKLREIPSEKTVSSESPNPQPVPNECPNTRKHPHTFRNAPNSSSGAAAGQALKDSRRSPIPDRIEQLNRHLLQRLYSNDYVLFVGLGRNLRKTVSREDFRTLRTDFLNRVDLYYEDSLFPLGTFRGRTGKINFLWKFAGSEETTFWKS